MKRLLYALAITFLSSCSEEETKFCFECTQTTTVTVMPGGGSNTETEKYQECDREQAWADGIEQSGTGSSTETIDGVQVTTDRVMVCEKLDY